MSLIWTCHYFQIISRKATITTLLFGVEIKLLVKPKPALYELIVNTVIKGPKRVTHTTFRSQSWVVAVPQNRTVGSSSKICRYDSEISQLLKDLEWFQSHNVTRVPGQFAIRISI